MPLAGDRFEGLRVNRSDLSRPASLTRIDAGRELPPHFVALRASRFQADGGVDAQREPPLLAGEAVLHRHHFPPRGLTSTYRPPLSKSLKLRSRALADRIAVSVSGTWGQPSSWGSQLPLELPPSWGAAPRGRRRNTPERIPQKPHERQPLTGCLWTSMDEM